LDGYYLLVLLDKPDAGCVNVKYGLLLVSAIRELIEAGVCPDLFLLHVNYDCDAPVSGYYNANQRLSNRLANTRRPM
jgi:hypothetical protein